MPTDEQTTLGEEIIGWIETLRVPEGALVGQPLVLMDWQKREILRIYDNPAGTRRAIISVGRKSGKTTLAACLLLAHLAGPTATQIRNFTAPHSHAIRPPCSISSPPRSFACRRSYATPSFVRTRPSNKCVWARGWRIAPRQNDC